MVTAERETYLAEINLRGGIRGARIDSDEYRERVDRIHREMVDNLLAGGEGKTTLA